MLSPNLEPGGRLSSCTFSNSQRSSRTDIAPFIAMFDPIRKPNISLGFSKLSTTVDNSVYNLFHFLLKETNVLARI
jgi:hypothetical protein